MALPQLHSELARVQKRQADIHSALYSRFSSRQGRKIESGLSTADQLTIASLGFPGIGLVSGAGKLIGTKVAEEAAPKIIPKIAEALRGGKSAETARATEQAATEARTASEAERAAQAERGVSKARKVGRVVRHPVRTPTRAVGRRIVASKTGQRIAQAAAKERETAVGRALTRGVRVAKPAAKLASYPVRHPLKGSVALQVPAAAVAGNPGSLGHAFTGTGVAAQIFGKLGTVTGNAVPGVAGNLLKDAFNLPATALPAVYLPLAGAVHLAATGDDSQLKSLLDQYKQHGLLPAIFRGDPAAALKAIKNHPLYSALELSGAYAVAGRGAGSVLRAATHGELAGTAREPLHIAGDINQERTYSKNVITKQVQKAADARRGEQVATPKEASRYISGAHIEGGRRGAGGIVHRFVEQHELKRRENRARTINARHKARPKAHENVVAEVAQGSIRNEQTFKDDIRSRLAELNRAARGDLSETELSHNRALANDLEAALKASPKQVAAIIESARSYAREHNLTTAEAVKHGLHDAGQVERARLFPYVQRFMGGSHGVPPAVTERLAAIRGELKAARARGKRAPDAGTVREAHARVKELTTERRRLKQTAEQLLDPEGRPLTTEQIHAHMRANGVNPDEVGFLSHAPGVGGSRSFNQRAVSRSQVPRQRRSGEAFRKGAYDASYDALIGQHAYTQGIVDRAGMWDSLVKNYGVRAPNGGYFRNRADAERVASNLGDRVPMVPLEISPWLSVKRELQAARESGRGAATLPIDTTITDSIDRALGGLTPEHGRFVLVPEELAQGLRAHLVSANALQRGAQSITQAFKYTVLPTSDKWILGNLLDQGTRAAFSGISPIPGASLYNRAGRRFLNEVERQHGAGVRGDIERQAISGGHFAQRQNYRVNEASSGLAQAFHNLAQRGIGPKSLIGPKGVADLYKLYANNVFRANGWMERQMELAGLGKAVVEDVRRNNHSWQRALTLQQGALEDLARGAVNTDRQVAFAHAVEDIFGRWRGNSPGARAFITGYAPFYLWARNATRFVLLTLPAKHPIKTALIAATETATEKERKKLGLDLFADRPLPGFLQGGISRNGGILPTSYYTSFGTGGNIGQLGNFILPQISGLTNTLAGFQWNGQQITHPDGTPVTDPRVLGGLALNSFAEGTIPFLSIARRVREGGGSPEPTSTFFTPKTVPGTAPKGGTSLLRGIGRVYVPRTYPQSTVDFLRDLSKSQTIQVPVSGGSGTSGGWSGSSSSSGGGWR